VNDRSQRPATRLLSSHTLQLASTSLPTSVISLCSTRPELVPDSPGLDSASNHPKLLSTAHPSWALAPAPGTHTRRFCCRARDTAQNHGYEPRSRDVFPIRMLLLLPLAPAPNAPQNHADSTRPQTLSTRPPNPPCLPQLHCYDRRFPAVDRMAPRPPGSALPSLRLQMGSRPRPQASPYICLARSPPDQLSPACNWRRRWAVAKRPPYTSRAACRMGVRMPSPTQTSRPVGGARAVPHIRDRGALALWMGGSAGQRLPGLSTRHCHLLPSMAYGSPKGRQTLRLLWGPCTLSAAMVVPGWSGMGA
jgi:hypothetical protein